MKQKSIIILCVFLCAVLCLSFPFRYKDGTEELSSNGSSGNIHSDYSSFAKYLNCKDTLNSYILSCEHIVVGVAKNKTSDAYRSFEISTVIKGNLNTGKIEIFDDPSIIGIFFQENNEYVLFLDAYLYPIPYAVFNVTENTAHSATKAGAILFDELPRDSKKLINFLSDCSTLSTIQAITDLHISPSYPPEIIRERSTFQIECEVKDVLLLYENDADKNIYRIYARAVDGNYKDNLIAFDQHIDTAVAKSIKTKSFIGYFDHYPIQSNKVIGFLDIEQIVK
ncbi:MAG: hypothetical protein IJN37_08835 [Clostridia bacterium]|nr:hypothetical protein [Clostridia bacterium]